MKKILFCLVFMLASTSIFAQKVTYSKSLYDSYNKQYIKTTVQNTTRKNVVCLEFLVEYDTQNILYKCEYTTVRINIPAGTSKTFTYYPPANTHKAIVHYLTKAIYSDGTYKEF